MCEVPNSMNKIEDKEPQEHSKSTSTGLLASLSERVERLTKENEELKAEMRVSDELLEDRNRILKSIPPCEAHGDQCIPHAMEWIQKVKTLAKIVTGK